MPAQYSSFRPCTEPRFASGDWGRAALGQHTPMQNGLLAALPPEVYERLLPELEPVPLPLGWIVHRAGAREGYLYFPISGVVSLSQAAGNVKSAEFALTGSEGAIGIASFLGGASTPYQVVVLSAGYAYRLPVDRLKREFEHGAALRQLLLRHTLALVAQTGQIAVCNRHHSLDQQLCRWILSYLDRSPSIELTATHELIAALLGVRREGVTEAAGELQRAGLIHYSRGRIAVLDRPALESRACECYAVIKREYDRLIRPKSIVGDAAAHRNGRRSVRIDEAHAHSALA
ncbi:MAG TPA: Crp/Fnr family transcriptional regulator [Burkholderiales bacterium]|nr:Crp/Fnr family transcriptional regulator [Burkholderiales bacterium]